MKRLAKQLAALTALSVFLFALLAYVAAPARAQHPEPKDTKAAPHPAPHAAAPGHDDPLAGETAAHGAEHVGEHHGPEPLNVADFSKKDAEGKGIPPLVAILANFVLLVGMYVYFGRKPIAEGLKNRRAAIAKEIEEAQRMRLEAEERAKMYQAKLEHLEVELATTKAALVEAGKGEKERIIKDAEEKAARMQRDAEFLVEQEMKQLRQDLWRDAVDAAVLAAEELLKKRITQADHERLAEDYLVDLAGPTRRPTTPPPANAKTGGAS